MTPERDPGLPPAPAAPDGSPGDGGPGDGGPQNPDAGDVVEGEIGHARLRGPEEQGEMGADLDKLPDAESLGNPDATGPG